MARFLQVICAAAILLWGMPAVSAPPLSFNDFTGQFRIVRCSEFVNGAPQPGTDICDVFSYPQLLLVVAGAGYELRFLTAGGDSETLPPLRGFRNMTATYVDEATFSGSEVAAVWMRRKTWNQTGQLLRQVSVVFTRASDGTPMLTMNDLDTETDPNRHVRRQYVLRRSTL